MTKINSKSQNGRSMVEMLGVLSIIGVLSVGGISAYSVAMKKHRANELLQQAKLMATTISAQAMTNGGTLPTTIAAFNSSYGNFSKEISSAFDDKGFALTISDVDRVVCEQLDSLKGGMVREIECIDPDDNDKVTAVLSFYKNLATSEAEGEKSPTGASSSDNSIDSGVCANGNPYLSFMEGFGDDPCITPASGVSCSSDEDCTDQYGTEGCCHPEKKICIARDIYDSDTDTSSCPQFNCLKNSDCGKGEFCNLKTHMTEGAMAPAYGTCEAIGEVLETVYEPNGEKYYYSETLSLTWWAAENWCKAQGLSMTEFGSDVWMKCSGPQADTKCHDGLSDLFSPWINRSVWLGLCDNYEGCFRLNPIGTKPIKEVGREGFYTPICQSN